MTRLEEVVLDLERHAAATGWDLPPRLYALVETAELHRHEPELAEQLGIPDEPGTITALEQPPLPDAAPLEETLGTITWPAEVHGCALVVERIVLPEHAEEELADETDPEQWAMSHPERQDVRLVVGVLRNGFRHSALRLRAHDSEDQVLSGPDLIPGIAEALQATLTPTG